MLPPPKSTLFPYTTLFRSLKRLLKRLLILTLILLIPAAAAGGYWWAQKSLPVLDGQLSFPGLGAPVEVLLEDRKSTRLNSSHSQISYAVFCLKKKTLN